jgi:hypothetical protein
MPFGIPAPPDQVVVTGSSLTITELTGRAGGGPRTLVLLGSGLPLMGAEWGSQLNMKTTWYPGNAAEATQQVLVPIELPSQWEGAWRRTLLSRTPALFTDETGETIQIVDPHILREVFEDMHRAGARLRVTWAVSGKMMVGDPKDGRGTVQDVRIIREGRVQQFVTPIDKHTDIRWRATFEWVSRGGTSDKVVRSRQDEDAGAAANALQASVNAVIARGIEARFSRTETRLSTSKLTLGKLETLADAPRKITERFTRQLQRVINDVKRTADIGRKFALAPVTVANGMLDFARNTTAITNQFIDQMDRTPPELLSNKSKTQDLMRSSNFFANMIIATQSTARAGQDLAERLAKTQAAGINTAALKVRDSAGSRKGHIIGIYICKEGDTPERVSMRYYGNPDRGTDILRANRLPWHLPLFTKGQKLVIPVLANKATNI